MLLNIVIKVTIILVSNDEGEVYMDRQTTYDRLIAEAEELDRMINEQHRSEMREKLLHPLKWRRKCKEDLFWKYRDMGIGM